MKAAIPVQVRKFLNIPSNRKLLRGIITSGNTNFGDAYCCAGPKIARKCGVPELYRFELLGTDHDVKTVRDGLLRFYEEPFFNQSANCVTSTEKSRKELHESS